MDAMEAMEYKKTFTIRQEESVRFQQYVGMRRGRKFILLAMVVVTLLARLIVSYMFHPLTQTHVLVACTIGMILGLAGGYFLLMMAIAYSVSQGYQTGKSKEYIVDVEVNPGGIYISDGKDDVRVYYDKMFKIHETSADFFVYPDKETAFLIPKHQMEDVKAESAQLRHMFKTYAPSDKLELLRG